MSFRRIEGMPTIPLDETVRLTWQGKDGATVDVVDEPIIATVRSVVGRYPDDESSGRLRFEKAAFKNASSLLRSAFQNPM